PSRGGDGAEIIYALRNTSKLSNLILEELGGAGQNIRKAYQRRLPSDSSKDYYFIHRDTGLTEPVIIEYGFVDSKGDDPEQLKNNYKKYANAIVRALSRYLDIPYELGNVYIVKPGDSLWGIAKKYNITVDELKTLNNIKNNTLSIGQVLKIPEKKEISNYEVYTIIAGDTLYKIAQKYNVKVSDIEKLNQLKNQILSIGQKLLIPVLKEPEEIKEYYIVKPGDSLYKIALEHNTTVDEIIKLNNLGTNNISIGQKLILPFKEKEKPYIEYYVKAEDTLYKIANDYKITIDQIKKFNNLSTNLLSIGQLIKIPITLVYTVKKGDTLYSLAQKYNTTVEEIIRKNNLKNQNLSINQTILI
ncbi:MAG: LysM peptidoglycan-binding domain-containing protein, partial [Bacilli bacterium]